MGYRTCTGKAYADDIGFKADNPADGFIIQQHAVGREADTLALSLAGPDHEEKIRIQERFTPTLEINKVGIPDIRKKIFKKPERHVLFMAEKRLRAIDAGGIALACDFNLNPVKLGAADFVKKSIHPPEHIVYLLKSIVQPYRMTFN
jgi:hypothetical protein